MRKLEVIKEQKNPTITIDKINLNKHLIVYGNFEKILCKCEYGYVFVHPSDTGLHDEPSSGLYEDTLEEVFENYGHKITVYEI